MKLERWRLEYGAMYSDELGEVCLTKDVAELEAVNAELLAALRDIYSGWQYIRQVYGDLYGVGWERCDMHARAAIAKAEGEVMP